MTALSEIIERALLPIPMQWGLDPGAWQPYHRHKSIGIITLYLLLGMVRHFSARLAKGMRVACGMEVQNMVLLCLMGSQIW